MPALPTGTVTFLFTDIEGSTRLLQQLGERYAEVLAEHRRLLRAAFLQKGGQEVDTQGDAFFVAFSRANDALSAAIAAQRAIIAYRWPDGVVVHVRMGLHTGEPQRAEASYVGMDVHRAARIAGVAHGGQILLSGATRALVQDDLPSDVSLRDLGQHRLKDLARPDPLYQVVANDLPADFPSVKSLDALPNNVPIQLTSFVGRERQIAEVKGFLSTTRLLTLTGAGGAGKTRLALQAAAEAISDFRDGVWLVELGSLTDPALVAQAIAATLGVREQQGRPLIETLTNFLRERSLLLILDNCEHLLTGCTELADRLLRMCPALRILATSREGLGITGELTYSVPSLSLPDTQRLPLPEHLMEYEAVRLFYDRAILSKPGFQITSDNAAAVSQIARRLDGIPLAIELAAARIKALSAEQIASRLDDRFRLLTGGNRAALPHHRTLQAVMDWGYNLLSDHERTLLSRLSVFAGGFTLEAAEAVCVGAGVAEGDVVDLLTRLVEKSLVVFDEQHGAVRYRLLETVRQYSQDRLMESGESNQLRTRHRDFFLKQAERRELPGLAADLGPGMDVWVRQMDAEHDNLRAALDWSSVNGEADTMLQLATAVYPFWSVRGYSTEGLHWLEQALSSVRTPPASSHARGLFSAGWLAWNRGDNDRAVVRLEESLALYRQLGDKWSMAAPLDTLAVVAYRQGNYARAAALLEESISLCRESGNTVEMASALYLLGIVARHRGDYERAEALANESLVLGRKLGLTLLEPHAMDSLGLLARNRGDFERAKALCEEALTLFRGLGDKFGTASVLNSLGLVACDQCDYERATALCHESLAMARDTGNKRVAARALSVMGRAAYCQGRHEEAATLHKESLSLFRELAEIVGIAQSLERLAAIATARGQPQRAAKLFAKAGSLRESIAFYLAPVDRAEYDLAAAAIQSELGEDVFASTWAEGRAMTLEQAVEYALSEDG